MILALVGHRFLIEEAARVALSRAGLNLRDVPWLEEDGLSPEGVAGQLQGGLFGPVGLVLDVTGLKDAKPVLEVLHQAPDAVAVLLDPESWTAADPSSEVTRKRKAQESRAKTYAKYGEVTLLPSPQKGALIKWVGERAKTMKLKLEPGAGQALAEVFPDDPAAIAGELEKLAVLDGPITIQTVRDVVNFLPPTTIFAVLEAATARRPGEAAGHLSRLLDAGEDPFKLMGALVGHYQLAARAFGLREKNPGMKSDEAGKVLAVHPFRAQKALEAVRGLSEARLRSSLTAILEADLGMKSGLEPSLTLERLVLTLAGVGNERA